MKGDVAALLHWKPGQEAEFAALWDEMTRVMLEHGSHGAALFRVEDVPFCALTSPRDED